MHAAKTLRGIENQDHMIQRCLAAADQVLFLSFLIHDVCTTYARAVPDITPGSPSATELEI